jgi:hypothetical protein
MLAPNAANSRENSQNTKLKNKDSKKENIKKKTYHPLKKIGTI